MRDILVIALEFAPMPSTGAYRTIEFMRRLPTHGLRPVVLTIHPDDAEPIFGRKRNLAMLENLPPEVELAYLRPKTRTRPENRLQSYLRLLTTLDDRFETRFTQDLMRQIATLRNQHDFVAVYATAPPFGASGLGARAAQALKLPYLLDMRDAWADWNPAPLTTRAHLNAKVRDETRAFGAATRITTVTEELANVFRQAHPTLPYDRFAVVPNGFDGVDALPKAVHWSPLGDTINIGYIGSFYYIPSKPRSLRAPHRLLQYDPGNEDWSYRSPLYFFRAWAALDQLDPELGARLRFHHVGGLPDWLPGMAAAHGLADRCQFNGMIPRDDIPFFMDRMTGFLATSMKRIGGDDYCLATKSFEYLTSGKLALGFLCPGAQKRFYQGAGGAVLFDPDDPKGAARQLQSLAQTPQEAPLDKGFLGRFHLDRTAADMASQILSLTCGKAPSLAS